MIKSFLILGYISQVVSQGKVYRFDYEFNSQADGWLKFHMIPGTWREARLRCHAEGATLASPLNKNLKSAIISFVMKHKRLTHTTIFTGVHASFSKGDYSSIEGVPLLRLPITWAAGEPDNFGNAESCLAMDTDSDGRMSDVRCGDVLPYVCYKKNTHLKMSVCGTSDPGYQLEPRTGSCYKLHTQGLVWQQAYMTCKAEGGHLAVIDQEIEAVVVKEIYDKYKQEAIHGYYYNLLIIGFHDWCERTTFMTIYGEHLDFNYVTWSQGEPNNATFDRTLDQGEFCGSVGRNGQLNDIYCSVSAPFLCEKHPNSLLRI